MGSKFLQGNVVISSGNNIQLDSYTISEFSNDDNLTGSSTSTLVTENAIKTYIDTLVATVSGAEDSSLAAHMADTTTHGTTTAIVGIDDSQTLTNKTLTAPDINGGTVDAITALTVANNVDIGNYQLTAKNFVSDVAIGTAPLTVTSTTVVSNLNADLLDGSEGAAYLLIANIDDTPVDSETSAPISSNWAYDHVAAADPHVGYVLETLFDANTVLYATSDDTPAVLTVTEQTIVGRLTGGNISAIALGIADNNIVQIDSADAATGEYGKFTANGLESKSTTEVKSDLAIDHDVDVANNGTNTHEIIDDKLEDFTSHAASASVHFTEASIDHDNITNTHNLTTDIDHNSITNNGTNTHAVIDDRIDDLLSHVASGSVHFTTHAETHITGTSDEIDGDKLDIDWSPIYYTPSTIPSEADSVDNLSAHLYGIDQYIGILENSYNRRRKVIDIVTSTDAPPTEIDGDRYIIDFSGATHAGWDGAYQGQIVEYDGDTTTWVATSASEGWVCYVDLEDKDAMYIDDGAPAWEFRTATTEYIKHDGTTELTGDWNYGSYQISGSGNITTTGNIFTGNPTTGDHVGDRDYNDARYALIDGDKLDIDWNPSYYTPSTSPSEADSVDNLTAHLYGIDQNLGWLDGRLDSHELSAGVHFTQSEITEVGTIATGVWEATDIGILHGGTGASTESDARTNLGLAIGSDVQAYDSTILNEASLAENKIIDGAWLFTVSPSSGLPSGGQQLCNKDYVDAVAGAGGFHSTLHELGGADVIDSDQLAISWNPTYYIPAVTPSEVFSVEHLTAHLYGIDEYIGTLDGRMDSHDASGSVHFTEASIDHDSITNTHNLTTDIDHDSITNTHNLTTDIDHDELTNFTADEHFEQSAITTVGTIATGVWEGTDVGVAHGGTGLSELTDHSVLIGSGTGAITPITVGTNGQVLVGSSGGDPVFATITDGEGITTTLGYGTLQIACEDASYTNKGIIERATTGEVTTGTDTERAVTPDALKDGYRGSTNVTTLGTIATGTWQATDVGVAYGGTGASTAADAFTALKQAASTTATGVVELATSAEVNTGTDTSRAITPDALAGSNLGEKSIGFSPFASDEDVVVGNGTYGFCIPASLNGMNIVEVHATVYAAGTTGTTDIQIRRRRDTTEADVLSTKCTIDSGETRSTTAAAAFAVNTSNDDLATGDLLFCDVDATATTEALGLSVTVTARLP